MQKPAREQGRFFQAARKQNIHLFVGIQCKSPRVSKGDSFKLHVKQNYPSVRLHSIRKPAREQGQYAQVGCIALADARAFAYSVFRYQTC
jgi:endonuclease YncB( thermonuclease family)